MASVPSANNAIVDGMVRSARSANWSVEQMRTAGQTMLGQLRELQAANPLIAEYFPGAGQWVTAISAAMETALANLTRVVPDGLGEKIQTAYAAVVGNDRQGRPVEIGPLLQNELVDLANAHTGSEDELRTAMRQHILGSQEIGDTRRALVEGAYQSIIGRGSNLAERTEMATFIDRRLGEGATLEQLDREIQQRVWSSPEKALVEKVGMVFWQAFPEHDPPGLDIKRGWTDWVQGAMAQGMSEDQALNALAQQLRSGAPY